MTTSLPKSAEKKPQSIPVGAVFVAKAVEQIHDPVISLVVAMFLIVVGCCWMFFSRFFVSWTSPTITMCLESFELEETNHNLPEPSYSVTHDQPVSSDPGRASHH